MYRCHVLICAGAGCVSSGEEAVRDALAREISRAGLSSEVKLVETGCMGACDLEVISKVEKVYAEYSRTVLACAENSAMHNGS